MPLAVQTDIRSQVAIYRRRGWYCVPLRPRSKMPVSADWPNLRIEVDAIRTAFSAKDNVGLFLGEPSPRRWTDARVVAAIQDRYVKGRDLHIEGLGDIRLANAAKRRFGSWEAAVEAAGLSGKIPIKKPLQRWTPEEVVAEIQAWHESGRRVTNICKGNQSLYNAAKLHFGSWGAAMSAAGFGSTRRSWSKQVVIDEIRERVRRGESLSSGAPINRSLAAVAYRYFGSWRKAIRAAGILSPQTNRKGA